MLEENNSYQKNFINVFFDRIFINIVSAAALFHVGRIIMCIGRCTVQNQQFIIHWNLYSLDIIVTEASVP